MDSYRGNNIFMSWGPICKFSQKMQLRDPFTRIEMHGLTYRMDIIEMSMPLRVFNSSALGIVQKAKSFCRI